MATFSMTSHFAANGANAKTPFELQGFTFTLEGALPDTSDATIAKVAEAQDDVIKVKAPKFSTNAGLKSKGTRKDYSPAQLADAIRANAGLTMTQDERAKRKAERKAKRRAEKQANAARNRLDGKEPLPQPSANGTANHANAS